MLTVKKFGTENYGPTLISIAHTWVVSDGERKVLHHYSGDGGKFRLCIFEPTRFEDALEALVGEVRQYKGCLDRLEELVWLVCDLGLRKGTYTEDGECHSPMKIREGDVVVGTVTRIAGPSEDSSFGRWVNVGERHDGLLHCQGYLDPKIPPQIGENVTVRVEVANWTFGRIRLTESSAVPSAPAGRHSSDAVSLDVPAVMGIFQKIAEEKAAQAAAEKQGRQDRQAWLEERYEKFGKFRSLAVYGRIFVHDGIEVLAATTGTGFEVWIPLEVALEKAQKAKSMQELKIALRVAGDSVMVPLKWGDRSAWFNEE